MIENDKLKFIEIDYEIDICEDWEFCIFWL